MRYGFSVACLLLSILAAPLRAEVPRVVADIAPVRALVAEVMAGLGEPELLTRPGVSPHEVSLRPSQARALQDADLVVWIGPALEPWLEKPLAVAAGGAVLMELLGTGGTILLDYRGDPGEAPAGGGHSESGGAGTDPHAWLDPRNAVVWLGGIAERLAALDPENGDRYRANAAAARRRIQALDAEIAGQLADAPAYVAYHDGLQYFERRYGLKLAGTVAPGDATDPGPARLAELRRGIRDSGVTCVLSEPQLNPGLLETAIEGTGIAIRTVDLLGSGIDEGPEFYDRLLREIAATFADCSG